jgi:hypothetical protein
MIEFLTEEEAARNNQAAFFRMQTEIDAKYPKGWYVGIYQGKLVADAESYEALDKKLHSIGILGNDVLVIQSGVDSDPDFLWIL